MRLTQLVCVLKTTVKYHRGFCGTKSHKLSLEVCKLYYYTNYKWQWCEDWQILKEKISKCLQLHYVRNRFVCVQATTLTNVFLHKDFRYQRYVSLNSAVLLAFYE